MGLAVLSLLSDVSGERPLLCLVDDAQWLDRASAQVLGFVGRRLLVQSVALVFGARQPGHELDGLPELEVTGLPVSDARALLDSVTPSRLDRRIRDRIVVETRGNPEVDAMINALGDVGGGLASISLVVADACCPRGICTPATGLMLRTGRKQLLDPA